MYHALSEWSNLETAKKGKIGVKMPSQILPKKLLSFSSAHLDKFIPFLLRIFNDSGGGSLAEELHEPSLHDEPETSGQIEVHSEDD